MSDIGLITSPPSVLQSLESEIPFCFVFIFAFSLRPCAVLWSIRCPFFVACPTRSDSVPLEGRLRPIFPHEPLPPPPFAPCICICICNPSCQICSIAHLSHDPRPPFIQDRRNPSRLDGHNLVTDRKHAFSSPRCITRSARASVHEYPPHRHSNHHRVHIASQRPSPASTHRRNLSQSKPPCYRPIKSHPRRRSGQYWPRFDVNSRHPLGRAPDVSLPWSGPGSVSSFLPTARHDAAPQPEHRCCAAKSPHMAQRLAPIRTPTFTLHPPSPVLSRPALPAGTVSCSLQARAALFVLEDKRAWFQAERIPHRRQVALLCHHVCTMNVHPGTTLKNFLFGRAGAKLGR
ncbi:hypothetical protein IWX50DRAFT_456227 [Phyllosticta citricarpa]